MDNQIEHYDPMEPAPGTQANYQDDYQNDVLYNNYEQEQPDEKTKKGRKEKGGMLILRIVISIVIIAIGIFLILFLVAKAAKYDSIGAMLNHMFTEVGLAWKRIIA